MGPAASTSIPHTCTGRKSAGIRQRFFKRTTDQSDESDESSGVEAGYFPFATELTH